MVSIRHVQMAEIFCVLLGLVAVGCGSSSSPTSPSAVSVASLTLSASSVVAGGVAQGTVTLTGPAPSGGVSVSLTSSAPSVATVASTTSVSAGASTATFTITALAAGTASITAALNGNQQSASLTVGNPVKLASLSLSVATIIGGQQVTGTVTLTGMAPSGGAVVALTGGDPVTVPASVTVLAGAQSADFTVTTRAVGGTITATITASFGGGASSATLAVTRTTVATASFGVTGPTESDTCQMANGGNTLNCTFNGSTSTAPGNIVAWDWTFSVNKTVSQTTSQPVLTMPAVDCSFLPPPPLPSGASSLPLTVTLVVHDDQGNVSAKAVHSGARVLPQGVCGY
jgi:hypothetical protein